MTGLPAPVYSYGIDSLQALSLSFSLIYRELRRLERSGWKLTLNGETEMTPSLLSSYLGAVQAHP